MISIAHVGYGYWGRNLARNFAELGALGAIIDPNPAAAAAGAAAHGVVVMSADEAIASDRIDAISIAAPAELHFDLAKRALTNGKHVFVEKPLALDVAEAEQLCALAEERRLVLMVGHLLHYHPAYRTLVDLVHAGEIGELRYAYSNRLSLGKFRTEENVLWSFAPHDVSMLLGLFRREPVGVSAQGCVVYTPGVADFVTAQMDFGGGCAGHVQVSWLHPFKEQRLVAIGDRGMAVFEDSRADWNAKLQLYPHTVDTSGPVPIPAKAEARNVPIEPVEPLLEECRHFVDCVTSGKQPRTDGREGLRVLRVLDRAERALEASLGMPTTTPSSFR